MYPQMRRALTRYATFKAKSGRGRVDKEKILDKSKQLPRVKLEMQRTRHQMPVEALQRLAHEIAALADLIRTQQEVMRRMSPVGCRSGFLGRASAGCGEAFSSRVKSRRGSAGPGVIAKVIGLRRSHDSGDGSSTREEPEIPRAEMTSTARASFQMNMSGDEESAITSFNQPKRTMSFSDRI